MPGETTVASCDRRKTANLINFSERRLAERRIVFHPVARERRRMVSKIPVCTIVETEKGGEGAGFSPERTPGKEAGLFPSLSDTVHDRRSCLRMGHAIPIRICWNEEGTEAEQGLEAETLDINEESIGIVLKQPFAPTDSGKIEIHLSPFCKPVLASIKLIWREDAAYRYGFALSNIHESQAIFWQAFCQASSSPAPERRQSERRSLFSDTDLSLMIDLDLKPKPRTTLRRMTDLLKREHSHRVAAPPAIQPESLLRNKESKYTRETVKTLREWVSQKTGVPLDHVGFFGEDPQKMKGNIENLIGATQIPLGIAGPLRVNGQFAKGDFYVPMATTEGTLVQSYHYGMRPIALAGGISTHILKDEIHISPLFQFENIRMAASFIQWLNSNFHRVKEKADKTTRYGKLERLEPHLFDRNVAVKFCYTTGDASGLNMIMFATNAACHYIQAIVKPKKYYLQSNFSAIKKVTAHNFISGYGKSVLAEAVIPRKLMRRFYNITPEKMCDHFQRVLLNTTHAGMIGMSGHVANGLAAIFIACGQDVAEVVASHVSIVNYEVSDTGDLYASVKLPNLVVGTVGGGTSLSTHRECLQMLDCYGLGKAKKFAEIICAATLAGEISIFAANAAGIFASSFQKKRKRAAT